MKKLILLLVLTFAFSAVAEEPASENVWDQLSWLEGKWEGTGDGFSGKSSITQTYEFVLKNNFMKMSTRSEFPPQEQNPKGEIHEDFAIFSYDGARKTFVLRAFYVEGFINTYTLSEPTEDNGVITFDTEAVENGPDGTTARLTFKKISDSEFEQSFYVAFPGKDLSCFFTNSFTKTK